MRASITHVCFYCGERAPTEEMGALSLCAECAAHERRVQEAHWAIALGNEEETDAVSGEPTEEWRDIRTLGGARSDLTSEALAHNLEVLAGRRRHTRSAPDCEDLACAQAVDLLMQYNVARLGVRFEGPLITEESRLLGMTASSEMPPREAPTAPPPIQEGLHLDTTANRTMTLTPNASAGMQLRIVIPPEWQTYLFDQDVMPRMDGPVGLAAVIIRPNEILVQFSAPASRPAATAPITAERPIAGGGGGYAALTPQGGQGSAGLRPMDVQIGGGSGGGGRGGAGGGGVGTALAGIMRRAILSNGERPHARRPTGPVRLPEGMLAEVGVHGAPADVDPAAMEAALQEMPIPTPRKCIQGDCVLLRLPGHAFCDCHLLLIRAK